MPTFSSTISDPNLTGSDLYYEKSSRHATYNFNQEGLFLYRNQPRLPFEYYINISLNNIGTARDYIQKYFNNTTWQQIAPLVKTVDMPSFKIETTPLNQYNRKRLSQTKIMFEPIKMVFHDVADGKTLKFWDMYYRYYFGDGNEPDKNEPKESQNRNGTYSTEEFLNSVTSPVNSNIENSPSSIRNTLYNYLPTGFNSPTDTLGNKQDIMNIVSNTLSNHKFGFNLPTVLNVRNLIQTIDIYQVHGGRFNQVTLVNPRIASFNHDTLNYSEGTRTLEISFSFEYEYAYYTIQNMKLGGDETNNNSTIYQYEHGDFLEISNLNIGTLDFVESNNPILTSDNPILQNIGKNVQSSIESVTSAFSSNEPIKKASSSVLGGITNISPLPYYPKSLPDVIARPFNSTAGIGTTMYKDVNRIGGNPVV